jgi:imidazolonepropionase-like amidohydrolase
MKGSPVTSVCNRCISLGSSESSVKNRCYGPLVLLLTFLLGHPVHASDQVPGKPQNGPILLRGGDVYTVSGDVIRGGWVLLEKGRIAGVGAKDDLPKLPENGKSIDVAGKRVYPSLIAVGNELGLLEIPSVRATRDAAEVGQINPNVRAEVAVNPDSELIPVTRTNGVLLNLTVPSGGLITGTSALMQLDGWTWEDMTVRAPVAMHIAWPRMTSGRAGRGEGEEGPARPPRAEEQIKQIEHAFDDARAYQSARKANGASGDEKGNGKPHPIDARWEAMLPVLDGKVPVFVWADELRQMESAVAFAAKHKVKLVILGGYDAVRCADLLKERKVPVVIQGTQRLPQRRDSGYDEPFTLPERLRAAGVEYCISYAGRFGSNVRNLPYHAGMAVAYGLPQDEALRSITLYPAKILNVADRVGSIEKGKDATLIVTDGDILETPTHVELAFVQGRAVDLSNKQTRLWEKYQQKYRDK